MNRARNICFAWGVVENMVELNYPRKIVLDYMKKMWKLADISHQTFKQKSNEFFENLA